MRKYFVIAIHLTAIAFLLSGSANAQQTPAAGTQAAPASGSQSTPAAKAPAAKPAAAKPAQAPAAKATPGTATTPAAKTTPGTATKPAAAAPALTTDKQKGSYAIGLNIGSSLKQQPVAIDLPSLFRGIKDARDGTKPALSEAEIEAALKQMQAAVNQKRDAELQKAGEANMKEGEAYLAANKTKEGVVTTASGLQYKILTAGTGPTPAATDTVVCNYRGTLINGTVFDSSYDRGKPLTIAVNHVIPGWTEALQLMPVGSKWQLVIPSNLAYGPRSAGTNIGPNSTLIFDVELLSIQGK